MATFKIPVTKLSKLAAAAAGADGDYDTAFTNELNNQSRIGQAIAAARLNNSKADQIDAQVAAQSPDAALTTAMTGFGVPQSAKPDVTDYFNTGRMPKYDPLPADQQGPVLPAPDWQGKLGPIGRQIMATRNAITTGDSNSKNIAESYGVYDNLDKQDQVIAGKLPASVLGRAVAASAGKPLVTGHEFGSVDNFSGAVDDQNPVAQRFANYRVADTNKENAQAGAAKASAAASYASAGASSAQAQKIRQDIENGKGVLRDTESGLVMVNPRDGTAKLVTGADGQTFGPKLKDIPTQVNTAILTNAQNVRKVDRALALLTGKSTGDSTVTADKNGNPVVGNMRVDPNATGFKGILPNPVVNYLDPKGVDARAEVTDIGSLILHDRSGAAVTASESPRLVPFIPLPSDSPETARKKLLRFKQVYDEENTALSDIYGPSNGYKPSPLLKKPGAAGPAASPSRTVTVNY